MPSRFASLRGVVAPVVFMDGQHAGTLGRISDLGFEMLLPGTGEPVLLRFDCVETVDDGRVVLNCDEDSLSTCFASTGDA
jgi:hypothetical protein